MALANFFDRAAAAAGQVLQNFDVNAFTATLESQQIGIAFDASAVETSEGRATADLALSLIARLYPNVGLLPLDAKARRLVEPLEAQARAINPDILIGNKGGEMTACVAIGKTPAPVGKGPTVYVGSNGWVARLSSERPVGSADTGNPFGAGAAACFGAANVFRVVFAPQLTNGEPDASITLSLVDYEPRAKRPQNPPVPDVDLGETQLVGLGAVGNGAAWALSGVSSLRGTLDLIDHEAVDLTNLQRYVLAAQEHREVAKVEVAERLLRRDGLRIIRHGKKWGEYLHDRGSWDFNRVAVGVDSAEDRIQIQAALPRRLLNAWTQPGDLGVSRHSFLGDDACMVCLYMPDGQRPSEDEIIARAVGMPAAVREVRQMLYQNTPVPRHFLERVATAMSVPVEPLLRFELKPLREFYTKAVCGGVIFKLKDGDQPVQAQVPMAFQSALAGIMLAGEIVIDATGIRRSPIPATTKINLLRPLAEYLSVPARKIPSGKCICQDPDYIAAYRAKYGGHDAAA